MAIFLLALAVSGAVAAQESKVQLKDGAGRDKVAVCQACHSLDYIPMNSPFLDKAGWTAEVNKMIKVYGAPVPGEDVDAIIAYLAAHYGKQATK